MATVKNWTWNINEISVMPQLENKTNVVINAKYTLTGSDGNKSFSLSGIESFSYIDGNDFIEFDSLTEQQIINWITNKFDSDLLNIMKNRIQTQIDILESPNTLVNLELPWSTL
jgi:hypothetical protein